MPTKSIFASKTFWVNVIGLLLDVLVAKDVIAIIPPSTLPYLAAGQAVLNIILRYITTQPVRFV